MKKNFTSIRIATILLAIAATALSFFLTEHKLLASTYTILLITTFSSLYLMGRCDER